MDDPELDGSRHEVALEALARLNWLSGSSRIVWRPLARLARNRPLSRLRVLDVATGAGDIPLGLWQRARRAGLSLEIHGVDLSERALDFARRRAAAAEADVAFSQLDVVNEDLPAGFDVVVCSLFLHHLSTGEAARVLAKMGAAAQQLVLVNDLRRCRSGLLLAHAAGRLLTRSDVVRADAPQSVRAAFSLQEVRTLAAMAGLDEAVVERRWPCRFLLTWRRK